MNSMKSARWKDGWKTRDLCKDYSRKKRYTKIRSAANYPTFTQALVDRNSLVGDACMAKICLADCTHGTPA
jgi:hypothetical protein